MPDSKPTAPSSFEELRRRVEVDGYAVLSQVDPDGETDGLLEIARLFGEPTASFGQPLVMDLKPKLGAPDSAYHGTTNAVALHTDKSFMEVPPHYLVMHCVRSDDGGGGIALVSDARAALASLTEDDRAELTKPQFEWQRPGHLDADGRRLHGIVETLPDGGVRFRFRRDLVGSVPERAAGAIERFASAADDIVTEIDARPGDVLIVDNWTMLHGRTEIIGGIGSTRLLRRVLVA